VELDEVLRLLAQSIDPWGRLEDLTEHVRSAAVSVLVGRSPASLAGPDASAIRTWVAEGAGDPGLRYEEMLNLTVEWRNGQVAVRRGRGGPRAAGAYYTGAQVLQYMVERAHGYAPDARAVIDPACGSGAFLAAVQDRFGIQFTRVVGLDVDPLAAALCRRAVPQAEVHDVDALLSDVPADFDLCLGNPPYISSGLRGAAAIAPERLAALRRRYPASAQYKVNTYPLFIERGLDLLRAGGVLGFILPDSFLTGRYFERVRALLLEQTILEITLVRSDFWRHGSVGQSVILFVRKGAPGQDHTIRMKTCERVEDLVLASETHLPLSDVVWGPLRRFRLITDPQMRTVVRRMESVPGARPLGDLVRPYSGLIGRKGQDSLLRSNNPGSSGPWGRLIRSGREIDRYRLDWGGEGVLLDDALIKSGGRREYYTNPKLLLRQTADALRAVHDDRGFYCLNNVHVLMPRQSGTDLRPLLGLLNSGPVNLYYQASAMEAGRLYAQVDLDILAAIPIPPLADGLREHLGSLVQRRERAAPQEAAVLETEIDQEVSRAYGLAPQRLPER